MTDESNETPEETAERSPTDGAERNGLDAVEQGATSADDAAEPAPIAGARRRFWQRRRSEAAEPSAAEPIEAEAVSAAVPSEPVHETADEPKADPLEPADAEETSEPSQTPAMAAEETTPPDEASTTEEASSEDASTTDVVPAEDANDTAADTPIAGEDSPADTAVPAGTGRDKTPAIVLGIAILVLIAVGIGLGVAFSGGGGGGSAIAKVDGQKVSEQDYQLLLGEAKGAFKAQKRPFPKVTDPQYAQIKTQIVNFLVQATELDQQLDQLGAKPVSDADVTKRLGEIKKRLGGEKKFQAFLKSRGITMGAAQLEIRNQLLQERAYAKVTSGLAVNDKDVAAYYQKNKAQFKQPASRKVRHILVKTKALADTIEAQLKAGGDFAKLAKQYSTDPGSKNQGGQLQISQGQTVPEFDKVAFSLPTGQISPPVKSQFGWHIIEAIGPIKAAHQQTLDEAAPTIRQQLTQQQKSAAWSKFQAKIKKQYTNKVKYAKGYTPETTAAAPPSQPAPAPTPTTSGG